MSKVVFGVYLYSDEEGDYSQQPTMLTYADIDFVEKILSEGNTLNLKTYKQENTTSDIPVVLKSFEVYEQYAMYIGGVPYMAVTMKPRGIGVQSFSERIESKGTIENKAYDLAAYVDKVATRIVELEDSWTLSKNNITQNTYNLIKNNDEELSNTLDLLEESYNKYYLSAKDGKNPTVPYRKFIERFFTDCNFYDIIPLLEKRAELFIKGINMRRSLRK